jgi:hypothetical protein
MFRIKLSPLILFLVILFILLLSVVFCKYLPIYPSKTEEGLISFDYSKKTDDNVKIPQYSLAHNVNKIYDSLFFDQTNGNIIMLFGSEFNGTDSSADLIGNSLTQMLVISRDSNNFSIYDLDYLNNPTADITPVIDDSLLSPGVSSIYSSWSFPTDYSQETYQLFYIPWGNATILHVVDISNNKLVSTHLYDTGNTHFYHIYDPPISYPFGGSYTDVSNNKFANDPCYNNGENGKVYKVGDFVGFDTKTGHLLIQKGSGASQSTDIYSGTLDSDDLPKVLKTASDTSPYTPNNSSELDKRGFNPIAVVSDKESAIVIYVPYLKNTLISLLSLDPDNSSLLVYKNSVRFNPNTVGGIDTERNNSTLHGGSRNKINDEADTNNNTDDANIDVSKRANKNDANIDFSKYDLSDESADSENPPSLDSVISDYYKKYWDNSYKSGNKFSDDFLLKTQIVPPICPSCPNCPSATTCTNCGGKGGSGILDNSGSSLASRDLGIGNTIDSVVKTAGNTVGEVVDDASKLAGNVVGTAGNLAEKIVDETSGLLHSAGSGLKHAVDDLSRGGYHNGYGGPSKYSRNEATNAQDATESGTNPAIIPYSSYSNYTLPPAVIDPYSYQGALSSKGGNPLPIMSDFSRFGR